VKKGPDVAFLVESLKYYLEYDAFLDPSMRPARTAKKAPEVWGARVKLTLPLLGETTADERERTLNELANCALHWSLDETTTRGAERRLVVGKSGRRLVVLCNSFEQRQKKLLIWTLEQRFGKAPRIEKASAEDGQLRDTWGELFFREPRQGRASDGPVGLHAEAVSWPELRVGRMGVASAAVLNRSGPATGLMVTVRGAAPHTAKLAAIAVEQGGVTERRPAEPVLGKRSTWAASWPALLIGANPFEGAQDPFLFLADAFSLKLDFRGVKAGEQRWIVRLTPMSAPSRWHEFEVRTTVKAPRAR
jgi:hypothetical protein